ncbi:DUF6668 family protein [Streptomyces sp. NPDC088560]|uniref:DUF6668 family protein n=1 Tax=Streptomyces sp. NPDC088560 TaxID=3365868 RepID=UPI0038060D12
MSAHGGAGATTLADVLGGQDVGRNWPNVSQGDPGQILIVARTHAGGLTGASRLLEALRTGQHPPGIEPLALILVADAPGRLPRRLAQRVRVLRAAAPTLFVPWIQSWRLGERTEKDLAAISSVANLVREQLVPMESMNGFH